VIEDSMLDLESIEFRVPLTAVYRQTRLARGPRHTARPDVSPSTSSGLLSLMH
jgi:hypothetical protein